MKPGRTPPFGREFFRHHTIWPRFRDAFRGVWQAYREEPNLRFHVFASSGAVVVAVAVGTQGWETAYLALTILAVLFAEMVNTAVERTVDFAADGERHPLAGQAKEVAAGAVLLTALHAVFAALYLFAVRRNPVDTVSAVWDLALSQPWVLALPVVTAVAGLLGGRHANE